MHTMELETGQGSKASPYAMSRSQQPRTGCWSGLSSAQRTLVYLLVSLVAVGVIVVAVYFGLKSSSSSSSSSADAGGAGSGSNSAAGGGGGGSGSGSGIRPTGANFDSSAPVTMSIVDYSGSSPVLRGSISFDSPTPDLTFDHAWLDSSIGAISIVHSSGTVQWGEFEFGATLIAHNPSLNAVNQTVPVYQVLVSAKPFGRWPGYPARRNWNILTDVTHPPPFKVLIKDANAKLLGTIQMADGLPINDPSLSQVRADNVPLRPLWHCGQMLKWQNAYTLPNANRRRWLGGITADSIRPTQAKQAYSTNPAQCMLGYGADMRSQGNGLAQWHSLPRYPLGTTSTSYNYNWDPNNDPNLYDYVVTYPAFTNSSVNTKTARNRAGRGERRRRSAPRPCAVF